jgi:hypothetical protein
VERKYRKAQCSQEGGSQSVPTLDQPHVDGVLRDLESKHLHSNRNELQADEIFLSTEA